MSTTGLNICLAGAILFSCVTAYANSNPPAQPAQSEVTDGQTEPVESPAENQAQATDADSAALEGILSKMHEATQKLRSVQGDISHLKIEDPGLLDSRILRTGKLYYLKTDDRSYLRVHFQDLKQDDFEAEARRDDYLFDGVWLTRIDYKLEQIDMFQQAPEDKPADVFELIRHNFPLIGFNDIKALKEDFEITLAQTPDDPKDTVRLLLTTRSESPFSEEYNRIDFWIDNSTYMPSRIRAHNVQGDIHDIQFSTLKINKNLEKAVFTVEKPAGFRKNIEPLKSTRK
jgi:hypothetical protein